MDTKKKTTKRLKSATRYPKRNSDVVVAFALHETYDNLATAQQMICNRKSSKDTISINSVPPLSKTDSTVSNYMNSDETSDNTETTTTQNDSDYYSVQEIDENQKGDAKEIPYDQPETLFSAQFKRHRNKKYRNNLKCMKLTNKNKGVLDMKNISFKCRNNKSKVINKLGKFYSKARNTSASDNLRLCTNSITNIVSNSRILKKVSAKENLLDTDLSFDGAELELNNSIQSSVSTVKDFSRSISTSTLVHQKSSAVSDEDNKDENEPDIINSVINLHSDNSFPFTTDVLNVAVAVTYNPNLNENETSEEKVTNEILTSSPPTAQSSGILMSQIDSGSSNEHRPSDITLTASDNELSQYLETASEIYLFAETKSNSNTIFIPDLEPQNSVEFKNHPTFQPGEKIKKQALLDSMINFDIYSELISSNNAQDQNINDKLIENNNNTVEENFRNNGDHQYLNGKKSPTGIHQKPITPDNTVNVQRNFELPNEDIIRKIFMDRENSQKKSCSDDIDTRPTTISELWEKIVVKLDLTVKRLEDNLSEKIVKELIKSTPAISKLARPIIDFPPIEEASSAKPLTISSGEIIITVDDSAQCDLMKNQMIDNIMLKLSIQSTKPKCYPSTSKIPLKIKKPKLINDFVEVLKPPVVEVDAEKGETVTISTDYAMMEETVDYNRLERFKLAFGMPFAFVKENIVIIASVTNFVLVLLCIYAFFVVVMKP